MSRRLINAVALLFTGSLLLALPAAASAAESPWWQILDGSRPTNLWKPTDSVQEIVTTPEDIGFGEAVEQKMEIQGKPIGCLGNENQVVEEVFCPFFGGGPATKTAADLETLLEPIYGSEVEVTGGPVGVAPLVITVPRQSVPPITFNRDANQIRVGTAVNKQVSSGGSGRLVVTVTNLGDREANGAGNPVTITDELPEGLVATGFVDAEGPTISNEGINEVGSVECDLETNKKVVCTFAEELHSYESIKIEIPVMLVADPPAAGAPGRITVSGGGVPTATIPQEIVVSPDKTPFAAERFSARGEEEGGGESQRAGSHPFQFTTTLQPNSGALKLSEAGLVTTEQPALPRNFRFVLPAGLVGNTTAVPRCTMDDYWDNEHPAFTNHCPDKAAIGVAAVTVVENNALGFKRVATPLFNLEPGQGEPARFGFTVVGTPVLIDTEVDPDHGYRVVASVRNATQLAQFISSTVTIWGTPGDPAHDGERGWACGQHRLDVSRELGKCQNPPGASQSAFLRMPVNCDSPPQNRVEMEPWNVPLGSVIASKEFTDSRLVGCNQVPFNPSIGASATSKLASNPSGLEFQLDMPNSGLLSKDAIAEGQAKKVEVTLPEGMTINPSQGEGLAGCLPADYARERYDSAPGEGCPDASKVGEVRVKTPLLEEEARGSLYVAEPHNNPFNSLVALYMVAKIPERGILIKQAGEVVANPVTGQIVTTFGDLPQLPFSSFTLRFREGGRAPLVTPPSCGPKQVVTRFTPWSAIDPDHPLPSEIVTRTSTFNVERGFDGGACPTGGVPPFHPGLIAGSVNNAGGAYSPFNVRLIRSDGEQEMTNFSIKLPPGVIGKLAGVATCSDAAIEAARHRTGSAELASPSCPASSDIGRTLVGAGAGAVLTYVPGEVYLAGPYNGAPLSIAAVTAAKVGPFDLGTVVVREAIRINPETAEVFIDPTGSDPLPHIIDGITTHIRDIRTYVDRPEFMLNPTSCDRSSTASTVLGSGLDFASAADDQPVTVSTPYQAAGCSALGFKPKLALTLKGGTKRSGHPILRAVYTPRAGDANLARAAVTLPTTELLDQSHIRTVCTRVQFAAGAGGGSRCPAGAVYGHARALTPLLDEPLEGPVFLRSSSHQLPDLVAALHSARADFYLVGRIDSVNGGIRNTFETPPDAPVSKFVLTMQGGKKGLITNNTDLCKAKPRATALLDAQNGKSHNVRPLVKASCGKARKHKRVPRPAAR